MKICQTRGCQAVSGVLPAGPGWIEYCPVCTATAAVPQPRLPDGADHHAARALTQMHTGLYAEAEEGFLSAARSTEEAERKGFYLWMSLLCRYGVSYVQDVLFENLPARRTNLFLPTFGRFPLPDTDLRKAAAFLELEPLLSHAAPLAERLDELDILLKEIRDCLSSRSDRSDVFIAWHDDEDGPSGPCRSFAARLNSQLALSKQCFSFVSFQDLAQHSVDHYEPHIYAALAAAKVMVIVIRNYDALGQKFLATEIQRFLHRKKDDNLLRIYFCGMKGHTGEIPAYLKKQGLEIHREDAENSDLCAQLVRNEVLAILRDQQAAKAGTDPRKPVASPQTAVPDTSAPIPAGLIEGLARVQFDMANKRWDKALERLGDLQEQCPTRSDPYLYMLLCQHRCQQTAGLGLLDEAFENSVNWQFALQYADPDRKQELDRLLADSRALRKRREAERQRVEQERLATERRVAEQLRQEEEEAFRQEQERRRKEQEKRRTAAEKRKQKEEEFAKEKRMQEEINTPLHPFGLYCEFTAEAVTLKRLPEIAASPRRMTEQDLRQRKETLGRRQLTAELLIPQCVTHIGYKCFEDFTSLKSIRIPEGVVSIGEDAFFGCTALSALTLPSTLQHIDDCAFTECAALQELILPVGLKHIGMGAFGNCTALRKVVIPGTVQEIDEEVFSGCTGLETVIIEDGVEGIYSRAFADCSTRQHIQPKMIYVPASVRAISKDAFARSGFAPFARKGIALVEEGSYAERYFKTQPYVVKYAEHPSSELDDEPVPEVHLLRSRSAQISGGVSARRPRRTVRYSDEDEFAD